MNQRIRELAEQAGWMMSDEVEGFNTRLEKFTELIVEECIVDFYTRYLDTTSNEDITSQVERYVQEHYGVRE